VQVANFTKRDFRTHLGSTTRAARQFLLQIFSNCMAFGFVIANEDQSDSAVAAEIPYAQRAASRLATFLQVRLGLTQNKVSRLFRLVRALPVV